MKKKFVHIWWKGWRWLRFSLSVDVNEDWSRNVFLQLQFVSQKIFIK